MQKLSFQNIILRLQSFWSDRGCVILQPYDLEMGAGTFHPATVLSSMIKKDFWYVAYVQPSRRPTDSRFAQHPNRLQHYYQFQVLLKPTPSNMQEMYLQSLKVIGVDENSDIRFIEDDWESPTLGASGLGWEVQCNGMEISQFTYMQQVAGQVCRPPLGEITYGLERVAMYVQGVDSIAEVVWSYSPQGGAVLYKDIDFLSEEEFSHFNTKFADVVTLKRHFEDCAIQCSRLIDEGLPYVAYDFCIKSSHLFNLLDARGALSVVERGKMINKIKDLAKMCCAVLVKKYS
jgi:glycyl-tRNA synthetase alpha chain